VDETDRPAIPGGNLGFESPAEQLFIQNNH
jgi:hypothetical protein